MPDFNETVRVTPAAPLDENAVVGFTQSTDPGSIAVAAPANAGMGVQGSSATNVGVMGFSGGARGVFGESSSPDYPGVYGINTSQNPGNGGAGIYGAENKYGGYSGYFEGNTFIGGILEVTDINTSSAPGLDSLGIAGYCSFFGPGIASGSPTVAITGDATCDSTITAKEFVVSGADFAEEFDILDGDDAEPGTVMVLDREGVIKPSCFPDDRKVAGIISGAGDYRPGIVLGRHASGRRPRSALALVGKVYCKVDANYASIETGDMLTTSPTHGHAMKASDPVKSFGAVIGKALRPLAQGAGLIPVLVALQ